MGKTEQAMTSERPDVFDSAKTADALEQRIVRTVRDLGRRGAVVAVSGGVDSGVVAGAVRPRARAEPRALPAPARA